MADDINSQEQPSVEQPQAEETQSNLPSDIAEREEEENSNPLDKYLDEDGKIAGKFDDLDGLMKSYNEAQEYIKKVNDEKAETGKEKAQQLAEQEKMEAVKGLVNEYVQNGNQLSDEIIAKGKELGYSEAEIKVQAYEARDALNSAYEVVGGQETYEQMMNDMASVLSDADKIAFNDSLKVNQKYALKGLYSEWQESQQSGATTDRVRGNTTGTQQRGYSSLAEMQNDLRYLQTVGRNDKAALANYEAKKALTPDSVIYGV